MRRVYNTSEAMTALDNLKSTIDSLQGANEKLRKENERLKEERYKDEELADMKDRLDRMQEEMNNGFSIPTATNDKISKWQHAHVKEKHWDRIGNYEKSCGAAGGRFSYTFLPTGIGTIITCKCACGAEFEEMMD